MTARQSAGNRPWVAPPSADDIRAIGERVLERLPAPFRELVRSVVIRVEDFPDEATERAMGLESPFDILGLYHGIPIGRDSELAAPREDVDKIYLYRRPLLDYWCETGAPLEDIVANTLIHEIGHHFGFSDEDMEAIEFGER